MKAPTYFDDSLPCFVQVVQAELGARGLAAGVVLRDTTGRLTFFCAPDVSEDKARRLEELLRGALGPYAAPEQCVVLHDALGAESVHVDPSALHLEVDGKSLRLVDRRIVGADWLRLPAPEAAPPPRFVFASIKGGVGRSTALCVAAAHLAARGLRVLAIDLDFEAPGLGPMLLDESTLPQFGFVDALVENGLSDLTDTFLSDLIGPSSLASQGGRIDVIPALGLRSRQNPADVLAKLARAYAEDVAPDGAVQTVLDQVRGIVDRVAIADRYDVVLVDARAGLHEASASAIIGLGAEVFLFGRDEEQTFQGYAYLLGHLARLLRRGEPAPEWLERLTPVQALAPVDAAARVAFAQRWESMVRSTGIVPNHAAPSEVPLPEGFRDVPWADEESDEAILPEEPSLLRPVSVLRNSEYDGFDPLRRRDLLSQAVYEGVFRDLLNRLDVETSIEESSG